MGPGRAFYLLSIVSLITISYAEITALSKWWYSIEELANLDGKGCASTRDDCDPCSVSINFEHTIKSYGSGRACAGGTANALGNCFTCDLPGSGVGRLLNVEGNKNCAEQVANKLISRNQGLFDGLKALPDTTCDERKLSSVYNLMIANGVVGAFGTESDSDEPRGTETSEVEQQECNADFECKGKYVCFENRCEQSQNWSELTRNAVIGISLGSAAVLAISLCLAYYCCVHKRRKNNKEVMKAQFMLDPDQLTSVQSEPIQGTPQGSVPLKNRPNSSPVGYPGVSKNQAEMEV